jgi:hypothetical protein
MVVLRAIRIEKLFNILSCFQVSAAHDAARKAA